MNLSAVKELPVLDLSAVINRNISNTFSWNSIAEQSTYIPIETTDEILLSSSVKVVHVSSDSYYVVDNTTNSVFRIDKSGKVISSFSRYGNGPGEYLNLANVHVNQEKETIQVIDSRGIKHIVYDLTGRLIRETSLREKELGSPVFISNDYIVFGVALGSKSPYKIYVTDNELNIVQRLFPTDTTINNLHRVSNTLNRDMALIDPDEDNETVFRITDKGAEPLFVLSAGSYRLAPNQSDAPITRDGVVNPNITFLAVGSFQNYYLVRYIRGERKVNLELWSKVDNRIVSRDSFMLTLPSGKSILLSPSYISEDTIVSFIQSVDVAGEIEGVDEFDNPIIVHIKLKK